MKHKRNIKKGCAGNTKWMLDGWMDADGDGKRCEAYSAQYSICLECVSSTYEIELVITISRLFYGLLCSNDIWVLCDLLTENDLSYGLFFISGILSGLQLIF